MTIAKSCLIAMVVQAPQPDSYVEAFRRMLVDDEDSPLTLIQGGASQGE